MELTGELLEPFLAQQTFDSSQLEQQTAAKSEKNGVIVLVFYSGCGLTVDKLRSLWIGENADANHFNTTYCVRHWNDCESFSSCYTASHAHYWCHCMILVTEKFSRPRLEREDFFRFLYSIVYSFIKDYFVVSLWYRLVLTIGNLRNSIAHNWEDLGSKSYVPFTPLNLWESKKGNGAAYLSARIVTYLKGSFLSKFRFKPASHS